MIQKIKKYINKMIVCLCLMLLISCIINIFNFQNIIAYTKYNLTNTQLLGLTAICAQENGSSVNAIRAEASLMANLLESNKKYSNTANGLVDYVLNGKWFAKSSTKYYSNPNSKLNQFSSNTKEKYIDAVRDVLINGNRAFPTNVMEHDCLSDIVAVANNGVKFSKKDRSQYIKDTTVIINRYGTIYRFYSFPDSKSDPFGYILGYCDRNPKQSEVNEIISKYSKSSSTTVQPNYGNSAAPSVGNSSGNQNNQSSSTGTSGSTTVPIIQSKPSMITGNILKDIFIQANNFKGTSGEIGTKLKQFIIDEIIPIVSIIGNLIVAGITVILGAQYIWSSAEGKSKVLESLPTFVVAIIFFYLGEKLVSSLISTGNQVFDVTSWEQLSNNIIWIVNTIVHYVSFAGIIVLGIKYIFASAEGKSRLKTSMGALIIGILFVFSASTVVDFIIKIADETI